MLIWITLSITLLGFAAHWWIGSQYGDFISTANSAGDGTDKPRRGRPPERKLLFVGLGDGMMVFVSVAVLCSSLFIILSGRYDDASQKWAFASVGSIFGFWCRRK